MATDTDHAWITDSNDVWTVVYADSDEVQWQCLDASDHYLRIARAAPSRDHAWYVLPHIGQLAPADDPRWTGPDRVTFDTQVAARKWADTYLDTHPRGHDSAKLDADQFDYDPDTGDRDPIDERRRYRTADRSLDEFSSDA